MDDLPWRQSLSICIVMLMPNFRLHKGRQMLRRFRIVTGLLETRVSILLAGREIAEILAPTQVSKIFAPEQIDLSLVEVVLVVRI